MSASSALVVDSTLSIPRAELTFRASRAGGPGGQHVNTSSTRVELLWNVERSRVLSHDQRLRLRDRFGARIDGEGNVRIVASAFRSQLRNREDAEERLVAMMRRALTVRKRRKKTRPSRSAVESRLRFKQQLSEKKQRRRRPLDES